MSSKKCARCGLVNFATEEVCRRCGAPLTGIDQHVDEFEGEQRSGQHSIVKRALVVLAVTVFLLFIFYVSLLSTSDAITFEQKQVVNRAIAILDKGGFGNEVFVLRHLVNYRATDNWWNGWVGHASAYAATNFPFEVVTLYPEFFNDSVDDVERASILLHESYHLYGSGEAAALQGAWVDKRRIGWTVDKYGETKVWRSTRELTANYAPRLFQCGDDGRTDCHP
jgi:hypothetical protein